MAQNREKDETIELKVPSDSPLSLSCPDNTSGCGSVGPGSVNGLDSARVDRLEDARPRSDDVRPDPARISKHRTTDAGLQGDAKKTVKRCSGCRKRVGLTGFRCRCGDLFCAVHRYSDRHDCSYDYKTAGREAIARENPVVRAAKILKV